MEKEKIASVILPLLSWYRENKRPLPFRADADPYRVWISEIMLQQTRIETVIPYYERFLRAFPTVKALAEAEDEVLMKCWEGLGYYSRARNLKKAAEKVMTDFYGIIPDTVEELLTLPGIGAYTAGAIASIAYGRPSPAVDGNVLRVICRLLADESDVLQGAVRKRISALLEAVYPKNPADASDLTQGLMELGEVLCTPGENPRCAECPLNEICEARKQNLTKTIPYRAPQKPRSVEEKTVFLLRRGDKIAIRKRPPSGLLANMWEFPSCPAHFDEKEAEEAVRAIGLTPLRLARATDAKHVFSHLEWHMRGYSVECEGEGNASLSFVTYGELRGTYALPGAFRAFLRFLEEEEKKKREK